MATYYLGIICALLHVHLRTRKKKVAGDVYNLRQQNRKYENERLQTEFLNQYNIIEEAKKKHNWPVRDTRKSVAHKGSKSQNSASGTSLDGFGRFLTCFCLG